MNNPAVDIIAAAKPASKQMKSWELSCSDMLKITFCIKSSKLTESKRNCEVENRYIFFWWVKIFCYIFFDIFFPQSIIFGKRK